MQTPAPIYVADVARVLGVGRTRVLQMDAVLQPTRDAQGRRVYTAERLAIVVARRETGAKP
jgi:hypothetical protein